MKKSKAPILLVTVVGALVLTLAAVNLSQYMRKQHLMQDIEAPNEEAIKKMQERRAQMSGGDAMVGKEEMVRGFGPSSVSTVAAAGIPDEPSIKVPNSRDYKPEFDPATTSSHWYDDDSYQKVNAGKREGTRTETPTF